MQVGLLFGTFDPIHIGHLALSNYIKEFFPLDEIWFIVSPLSPFKMNFNLTNENHRLNMVNIAIKKIPFFKCLDIEFHLPKPSYTINTLNFLSTNYKNLSFYLIMGSDNYINLNKWYNYQEIITNYKIIVYPRDDFNLNKEKKLKENIYFINAPKIEISSTFIRNSLKENKNILCFLPDGVYEYIKENKLYTM